MRAAAIARRQGYRGHRAPRARRGPARSARANAHAAKRASSLASVGPTLFRLVVKLQSDEETLQGPQQPERDCEDRRDPEKRVNPVGRAPDGFDDDGGAHYQKSRDQNYEH